MSSEVTSYARTSRRLARLFHDAFAGEEQDFTRGPMRRAVLVLAIPMVLEMAMESVFAIVDIFFVAQLGAAAVAAVGLTEAIMTLVYAVAVGLGMGVTALVARRVGEGDDDAAAEVAGQALWLGAGTAVLVGFAGLAGGEAILRTMGADEAVIAGGAAYTRILLGGSASVVFIFLLNAAFRGAGVPAIAMRALILANAINITLDPCLIFGLGPFPALGVGGAAVATTIGRTIGVVYLLAMITRGQPHLRLRWRHLTIVPRLMRHLIGISLGGILQFLVATASWVVLMRLVATFGNAAIAGYAIAIRIIDFTLLPAWGLSNAAATLVGQNLGAAAPARAADAVRVVLGYTLALMLAVACVFLLAADVLAGIFTTEAAIVTHATACLRLVALGYGFFAVGMVLTQAFNGAGDTWTPTAVNLMGFWVVQLPLAWCLARPLGWGPNGVFIAITVAEIVVALLAWWVYRRGRWRSVVV
ncbi:MAG: MATE family efflux transporter [Gammaproteobacteria bacterium]